MRKDKTKRAQEDIATIAAYERESEHAFLLGRTGDQVPSSTPVDALGTLRHKCQVSGGLQSLDSDPPGKINKNTAWWLHFTFSSVAPLASLTESL